MIAVVPISSPENLKHLEENRGGSRNWLSRARFNWMMLDYKLVVSSPSRLLHHHRNHSFPETARPPR